MTPPRVSPGTVQELAEIIGYHLASMVSGNNQPHMSGDPRQRIQPARRRQFDDACQSAAEAVLARAGAAQAPAEPVMWANLVAGPAPAGGEMRIRAWTADRKRMESLQAEGLDMQPLYAGPPSPVPSTHEGGK